MENLNQIVSKEELCSKVEDLSLLIDKKYKNKKIVILGVMNGAFFFMHDLMKKINIQHEYDFLFCSSYYGGTESKGGVEFRYPNKVNIENKNIIILEDIIDTGKTIKKIYRKLLNYNPKNIDIATLFIRKRYNLDFKLLWSGYKIKNEFIVGYGLDYDEKYRNLEDIYELKID